MSHAGMDGVVQEYRVDRLAHRVVATERKGNVGHAAGHVRIGKRRFNSRAASMKATA
jgi:hypothetical protein